MPSFALASAFHSLRSNPYTPIKPASCDKPASASASHEAFFAALHDRLLRLETRPHISFLSIAWLLDALDVALRTFSSASALAAHPPALSSHKDSLSLLRISLDDTAKLLDVCNALKEALHNLHHFLTRVRYAALCADAIASSPSSREPLDEVNVNRAKDALSRSVQFMVCRGEEAGAQKHARSELETCRPLLRRSGERLQGPCILASAKGTSSFDAIQAAKAVIFIICSVLSSAISAKPRGCPDAASVVDSRPWASTLLQLEHDASEEVERQLHSSGSVVLLEGVDEIRRGVEKLFSTLSSAAEQKLWPKGFCVRASSQSLLKSAVDLQQSVSSLEQKTDELFRGIVAMRGELINNLWDCGSDIVPKKKQR